MDLHNVQVMAELRGGGVMVCQGKRWMDEEDTECKRIGNMELRHNGGDRRGKWCVQQAGAEGNGTFSCSSLAECCVL